MVSPRDVFAVRHVKLLEFIQIIFNDGYDHSFIFYMFKSEFIQLLTRSV